jgi:hypothetical protein
MIESSNKHVVKIAGMVLHGMDMMEEMAFPIAAPHDHDNVTQKLIKIFEFLNRQ